MLQEVSAGSDLLDDVQRQRIIGHLESLYDEFDHTSDLAVQNQLSIIKRDAAFEHS